MGFQQLRRAQRLAPIEIQKKLPAPALVLVVSKWEVYKLEICEPEMGLETMALIRIVKWRTVTYAQVPFASETLVMVNVKVPNASMWLSLQ